jgi:hypothetical protein
MQGKITILAKKFLGEGMDDLTPRIEEMEKKAVLMQRYL